jgi:hypothetical protein
MLECWNKEAVQRPSFIDLYKRIQIKWEEAIQNQPRKGKPPPNPQIKPPPVPRSKPANVPSFSPNYNKL